MTEAGERIVPRVPVMKKHTGAELQDIAKRASKAIPGAARSVNLTCRQTHAPVHRNAAVLQHSIASAMWRRMVTCLSAPKPCPCCGQLPDAESEFIHVEIMPICSISATAPSYSRNLIRLQSRMMEVYMVKVQQGVYRVKR